MSRLQSQNIADFTGGLNLRRNEFTLADNESPEILNMEVDPAGGFFTRKGWRRWNDDEAVVDPGTWGPRNAFVHLLSDGTSQLYVTNVDTILVAGADANFSNLSVSCGGEPHLADFTAWGDTVYIACGTTTSYSRSGVAAAVALTDAFGNFNDDYTTPAGGVMPVAQYVEAHSGYLFTANITEDGSPLRNRLRWSHPNTPGDWAEADYIDIEAGGSHITGLMSFRDHLLIFKTSSVWALYGYNSDSWQLVRVSESNGCPTTTAMTQSEGAVYFFSMSGRAGVYAYDGGHPIHISEQLTEAVAEITDADDIWLAWVGRRLWCSLPWIGSNDVRTPPESSAFVLDLEIGNGAWVQHRAAIGSITCIVQRSDVQTPYPLAAISGDAGVAVMVQLEFADRAEDTILAAGLPSAFVAKYVTGWHFVGFPERRKSWRRPRIIIQRKDEAVSVRMDTYRDYNEAYSVRSHTFAVSAEGAIFWRATGALEDGGFDWGDGSTWGSSSAAGSSITRAQPPSPGLGGLGVSRSIQLHFMTDASSAGIAWGVNAVVLKYILRRLTT